jgi:hypothetical protein
VSRLAPGDPCLLRDTHGTQVRFAFPHVLVRDDADLVALWVEPGARGKVLRHRLGYFGHNELVDHVWAQHRVLRLVTPGSRHSVDLMWHADGSDFRGWYINLQAPLRRTALGFDTTDHDLDLWIAADGQATWKDEDELAEAVACGAFAADEAAAFRREGERVLARFRAGEPPFHRGWETWRPDPAWALPALPEGWDRLPTDAGAEARGR